MVHREIFRRGVNGLEHHTELDRSASETIDCDSTTIPGVKKTDTESLEEQSRETLSQQHSSPLISPRIRFRTLSIQGFKSFPDRTVLDFCAPICAVVGPNGCGKSNILDALRWVLGEQGPSQLRAQNMADVIFNGSANRKPLGMAEISLSVECPDGALAIGYREIEITRRLYRNGESEYRINRSPCRLKDITDLFLDTGVGKGTYSLIEQGRVDALVTARPEERRGLLEQVAGIQKFKVRKKEALGKLDAAERNLERLQDLVSDVRSRRLVLARQVKKAQRYREIRSELDACHHRIITGRYARVMLELNRAMEQEADRETELHLLNERLQQKDARMNRLKEQTDLLESELKAVRGASDQNTYTLQYLEKRIADLKLRENEVADERIACDRESAELTLRGQSIDTRQHDVKADVDAMDLELPVRQESLDEQQARIQETAEQITVLQTRLKQLKDIHLKALEEETRIRNRQAELDEALRRIRSRMDALDRELRQVQAEESLVFTEADQSALKVADLERSIREIEETITTVTESYRVYKRSADELGSRIRENETRLLEVNSRLKSLEEVNASGEGLGDGVKAILIDFRATSQVNGHIAGVLADLYETEPCYERPVTAALEYRMHDVVVRESQAIRTAIDFLSSRERGRCTFLPVHMKRFDTQAPELAVSHTARPVMELIRTPSEFEPLFRQLLHQTYLVADLAEALAVWRNESGPVTLVTMAGEVIRPEGAVTGGKASLSHYRSRKREINDLRIESARYSARLTELRGEFQQMMMELEDADSRKQELTRTLSSLTAAMAGAKRDRDHLSHRVRQVQLRRDAVESEQRLLTNESRELRALRDQLETKTGETDTREETASQISDLEMQLEEHRSIQQDDQLRLSDIRIQLESIRGRISAGHREIKRLQDEHHRLNESVKRLAMRSDQLRELSQGILSERNQLEMEFTENSAKQPGFLEQIAHLEIQLNGCRSEQKDSQIQCQALLSEYRLQEEALAKTRIHSAELRSTRSALREQTHLDLDRETELLEQLPAENEIIAWRQQIEALEQSLVELGDVNLAAEAEHRELVERNAFLDDQIRDVEESNQALRKTIREINKTSCDRFMDAFESVNRHFSSIFTRLFQGGEAALTLLDPEDPLESGIDIVCRPPGKKSRTIDLLSGGEKALSALALLFAGFQFSPSPILFLDEVDAPLDDVNVVRFTQYLKDVSQYTQVMMITHHSITMEAADILYGVTMEEPGISRLVTARFDDSNKQKGQADHPHE